jgi:hypothetical protein
MWVRLKTSLNGRGPADGAEQKIDDLNDRNKVDNLTNMVVWCEWRHNGNAIGYCRKINHVGLGKTYELSVPHEKVNDNSHNS